MCISVYVYVCIWANMTVCIQACVSVCAFMQVSVYNEECTTYDQYFEFLWREVIVCFQYFTTRD